MPAFNSLDMIDVIENRQPALWAYGHTHECDDQKVARLGSFRKRPVNTVFKS